MLHIRAVGRALLLSIPLGVMASVPAVAADATSSPFTKVTVNLASGVLEQTLPFDVPFLMTGTVTPDVATVSARFAEIDQPAASIGRPLQCNADAKLRWQDTGQWNRAVGASGDTFTILVPRLDANRYYCFLFTVTQTVPKATVDAFQAEAADRLDRYFQRQGRVLQLSATDAEDLRQNLIALVADPTKITAPRDSIFNPTGGVATTQRFIDMLRGAGVVGLQNRQASEVKNVQTAAGVAAALLSNFADPNGPYARLVDRLDEAAAKNPTLSPLAAQVLPSLQQLRTYTGLAATRAAAGEAPGTVPSDLADVWDPAVVKARVDQVQVTRQAVTQVADAVQQLANNQKLLAAAEGLAPAEQNLAPLSTQVAALDKQLVRVQDLLDQLQTTLADRKAAVQRLSSDLGKQVSHDVGLIATSVGDFSTRHAWYIGLDLGFAYAFTMGEVFPYVGTNIYFRPVNKAAPLRAPTDSIGRRVSAMAGITVWTDLTKPGQRAALFNNRMVVLGGGVRLTDSIRTAGGILLFRAFDPNPTITDTHIAHVWFWSMSIDWDVKDTITSLVTRQ